MNELPETTIGVLRMFDPSKSGIIRFSNLLTESIKQGEVHPLEAKAFFRAMEAIIKQVDEATKENQLTALDKFNEKRFEAFGIEFEKCDVGITYDYESSGDPIYNHRLQIFESAKQQLQDREKFLKSLKEPLTLVDDESGEVVTVRPPIKKSSEGFKTYLK